MGDKYTDPLVKIAGVAVILAASLLLLCAVVLWLIDNQRDICPYTKKDMTYKECKAVQERVVL